MDAQRKLSLKTLQRKNDVYINKKGGPVPGRGMDVTLNADNKVVKLKHVGEERPICTDSLHTKAKQPAHCADNYCVGSVMETDVLDNATRAREEIRLQAKEFIDDFYQSIKRSNTIGHLNRWEEIEEEIDKSGRYDLTTAELTYGARTAWRNAPRCIGRIQWSKLQVFDARHVTTARGMFEAICNHLKYSTNNGMLRSAMTVFPARTDGKHDFRVWNQQYIRYAGYQQADGSIVGDPANLELTQVCQRLGWYGEGTMFDILPLVLQANGGKPELFELPSELVLEVKIKHPEFPKVEQMGLKWCAVPAVSNMAMDCGGVIFPAAPFSGWFMVTEIGARDLCDPFRYNLLEEFATQMGFDIRNSSSLWKDRTLVEVNVAVLHSFQSQGVTIVDHHTASASFMKHLDNEQKLRGGCPADWVWIVPPVNGSAMSVFHQEMLAYKLKPSLEYQVDPCKISVWKKVDDGTGSSRRKIKFRPLSWAIMFTTTLMQKRLATRIGCVILYASETGRSEVFANRLHNIFKQAFHAKVMCMDEYDVNKLEKESLLLIVASTSGSGDPPENGQKFAEDLLQIQNKLRKEKFKEQPPYRNTGRNGSQQNQTRNISRNGMVTGSKQIQTPDSSSVGKMSSECLINIRYSVFGLGNSSYQDTYCAFGHSVDDNLHVLGAQRIYRLMEGDELKDQDESFTTWAKHVFKAACDVFSIRDSQAMQFATGELSVIKHFKFRVTVPAKGKETDIIAALSRLHKKKVLPCRVMERRQLQSPESGRQTNLIKLDTTFGSSDMLYEPGEHVSIFPENSGRLVEALLKRIHNAPSPDQVMQVEILNEKSLLGTTALWEPYTRLPSCTIRTAFSRFLDITTPPSQPLLKRFVTEAVNSTDRKKLETLANDSQLYAEWKNETYPNMLQVLDQFPSLRMSASLLLTQLPLLIPRLYSISSSQKNMPGELHVTVAVIKYRKQGIKSTVHEGVSSTWLNTVEVGETIPCAMRHFPAFRMPDDPTVPMILIANGAGIAPFRSFWQERKVDMETLPRPHRGSLKGWGNIWLYFGCRNSQLDNIYKDELTEMKKARVLKDVFIALSREAGIAKTYVQTILKKNASEVFNCLVNHSGHIYICGNTDMANDIKTTLESILIAQGNMSKEQAKTFMTTLKESKHLHIDVFSVMRRGQDVTNAKRYGLGTEQEVTNGTRYGVRAEQEVTNGKRYGLRTEQEVTNGIRYGVQTEQEVTHF